MLPGGPLSHPSSFPLAAQRELHELHQLLGYVATVPQRERSGEPEMKKARNDPTMLEEPAKTKE